MSPKKQKEIDWLEQNIALPTQREAQIERELQQSDQAVIQRGSDRLLRDTLCGEIDAEDIYRRMYTEKCAEMEQWHSVAEQRNEENRILRAQHSGQEFLGPFLGCILGGLFILAVWLSVR